MTGALTGGANGNGNQVATLTASINGSARMRWTCATMVSDGEFGMRRRPVAAQTWVGDLPAGINTIVFAAASGFFMENVTQNQVIVEPYL